MPKIEDRKLTTRENMMRILRGEMPEWAPVYTMGGPLPGEPAPLAFIQPDILDAHDFRESLEDPCIGFAIPVLLRHHLEEVSRLIRSIRE